MTTLNKVVAVTRYTDCDAEFTFLGVFSSGQRAHQEISKNIDAYGKFSYRKDVGSWDYELKLEPNEVSLIVPKAGRASVRYRLTETNLDTINPVTEF